jgi:hypothetical protein
MIELLFHVQQQLNPYYDQELLLLPFENVYELVHKDQSNDHAKKSKISSIHQLFTADSYSRGIEGLMTLPTSNISMVLITRSSSKGRESAAGATVMNWVSSGYKNLRLNRTGEG